MGIFWLIALAVVGIVLDITGLNEWISSRGLDEEATYIIVLGLGGLLWAFLISEGRDKE